MTTPRSANIHWHEGHITRADRERAHGHRGATIWFTGLPGSGKSTLAWALEEELFRRGCRVYVLDGDNLRHGLNRDLGFGPADRKENIRRTGEVARLFTDAGTLILAAFVSPYREDRDMVRALLRPGDFIEVFVDCDPAVCEQRDPKGLYRRARSGEIPEFTGVSAPYEPPLQPELVLQTDRCSVPECLEQIVAYLETHGYIAPVRLPAGG